MIAFLRILTIILNFYGFYLVAQEKSLWCVPVFAAGITFFAVRLHLKKKHIRQQKIQAEVDAFSDAFDLYLDENSRWFEFGSPEWFKSVREFERRVENKNSVWKMCLDEVYEYASSQYRIHIPLRRMYQASGRLYRVSKTTERLISHKTSDGDSN